SRGTMVWTGTHVLMWGKDQGAALDPTAAPADRWKPLPTANGPGERSDSAVSVGTGSQWLVWGGEWRPSPGAELVPRAGGATYDPVTGAWEAMATGAEAIADALEAVWTGCEVIAGGAAEDEAGDCEHRAGACDPTARTWRAIRLQGTPFESKLKPTTNE